MLLHRNVKSSGPTVLVVKDEKGAVFGCFSAVSWEPQRTQSYIGTGETFLFTTAPQFQVWHWSHANSFFMLAKDDGIAVGGGGCNGLWLDAEFNSGTSGPSSTFNIKCLASSESFYCLEVQCWSLD